MDPRAFTRLATAVLSRWGRLVGDDPTDPHQSFEDERLIISARYRAYDLTRLEITRKATTDLPEANVVTVVEAGRAVRHHDEHRAIEWHLIGLARELNLPYTGIPDKIDPLSALDARLAMLDVGGREIDAALWWIFADHSDTDPDDLAEEAQRGVVAYLDRVVGPKLWREPEGIAMVPKLSTSLDALRHYTHSHLPGWGREMREPASDRPETEMPGVRMWRGGFETPMMNAPTLELAAFRAAVQALLAVESGFVTEDSDADDPAG